MTRLANARTRTSPTATASSSSKSSSGGSTPSWSTSSTCRASATWKATSLRREIRLVVEHLCDTENTLLNRIERERLIDEVLDETFGFGPLELLLKDPTISDILINGPQERLRRTPRQAGEDRRQVPRQRPPAADHRPHRVEGRPPRRRNVARWSTPACPTAPASTPSFRRWPWTAPRVSIRRFGANPLKLEDLLNYKAFTPEMVMLLEGVHQGPAEHHHLRRHRFRQDDAAQHAVELHPERRPHRHDRGRGRTAAPAGPRRPAGNAAAEHRRQGRASPPRDLVRNALRMRPERIIIGECRGAETLDMLQAMNTGHDGSHDHAARQHAARRAWPVWKR